MIGKSQYTAIIISILVFATMYFTCETKPSNIKDLEKSRSQSIEVTGIQNILNDAKKTIRKEELDLIETIETALEKDTSKMIENLKSLSGQWFEYGHPTISGYYAEEIAKKLNDGSSWAIAGTSYIYGIKQGQDDKIKEFSKARAIKALETAISLEPDNVEHRVNLALCYVEKPDAAEPMKGILMLRDLNQKHPGNIGVLNQLARLALKTNQVERAIQRLTEALKIDGKNQSTICLLAEAYTMAGDQANAAKFNKECKKE